MFHRRFPGPLRDLLRFLGRRPRVGETLGSSGCIGNPRMWRELEETPGRIDTPEHVARLIAL
jgi:hypothetical protein